MDEVIEILQSSDKVLIVDNENREELLDMVGTLLKSDTDEDLVLVVKLTKKENE